MVVTIAIQNHMKTLWKVTYQCHKLRQGGHFKLRWSTGRIWIFKEGEQVYSWKWIQNGKALGVEIGIKVTYLVNSNIMYWFGAQRGCWQNYSANIKCLHFGETGWRKPLIYFYNFPQIYSYPKVKILKTWRTRFDIVYKHFLI